MEQNRAYLGFFFSYFSKRYGGACHISRSLYSSRLPVAIWFRFVLNCRVTCKTTKCLGKILQNSAFFAKPHIQTNIVRHDTLVLDYHMITSLCQRNKVRSVCFRKETNNNIAGPLSILLWLFCQANCQLSNKISQVAIRLCFSHTVSSECIFRGKHLRKNYLSN
jgi:hypothetical protein